MKRQTREELERQVQLLERRNPDWSASQIEAGLKESHPAGHGEWVEYTPNPRSRLRAIQRWRTGARGRDAGRGVIHSFPHVWPVGERQRQELDPTWSRAGRPVAGSWRIFLYNCAPEVVRDVRIHLDGREIDYAPSILEGRFTEVHWQRIDEIRAETMGGESAPDSTHELRAEFVIARGTRQAEVLGTLTLDPDQGWTFFAAREGRQREIE